MTKTMLENLYNDALALMEGMRDYVQEDARQDRVALPWDKRDVIIQVNRLMVVRLCHALQLIEAHRARLAGDPQAGEPPRIGLAPVPVDNQHMILPNRLLTLCQKANHLFERLHAVHLAILPHDGEAAVTASKARPLTSPGTPDVATPEMREACASTDPDGDEWAYA